MEKYYLYIGFPPTIRDALDGKKIEWTKVFNHPVAKEELLKEIDNVLTCENDVQIRITEHKL